VRLTPIIERLQQRAPQFKLIGGSAQLQSLSDNLPAIPALFVAPSNEAPEASPWINGPLIEQRVVVQFATLIACQNMDDVTGEAALLTLEDLREAVRDALMGWSPLPEFDNIEWSGGDFLSFDTNMVLWWADRYRTAYTERKVTQ
jgi:hypothetical protein